MEHHVEFLSKKIVTLFYIHVIFRCVIFITDNFTPSLSAEMTQARAEAVSGSGEGGGKGAMDTRRALLCLVAIFLVSLSALTFVYKNFPHLEE